MPKAMTKPVKLAPGQERSLTVSLKSARNPPLDVRLSSQPLDTSVLDLKTAAEARTRVPVAKMKLLHNKRPVPDTKILKDLVADGETTLELTVIVMGGAAAIPAATPEKSGAAEASTGAAVVETDAFWADLRGFLLQRIKDEDQASELSTLFRSSWEAKR